ncbi:chorismate mutase [Candidatus Bipolaricaulota bacterium]|nr:chorismate mutase [Candidatus Bipolaricaulota bacterium]
MSCRGMRGATSVGENSERAIIAATRTLLERMVSANGIATEDIASVLFTTTPDLNAAYPARAARDLGWTDTPLLGAQEIDVPNSLPRCVRVLILWNTDRSIDQIVHIYLGAAAALRPDLVRAEEK